MGNERVAVYVAHQINKGVYKSYKHYIKEGIPK